MEDGGSGNSPWLPNNTRDEKKKYRSLKRKYRLLEEENADLSEEVVRSRRLISRLQNERTFILDRLLKLERFYRSSDTDTDSGGGSSSESEMESEAEKPIVLTKKEGNGVSPTPKRPKIIPSGMTAGPPSLVSSDPESLGLCTAVVRDRPCKSKSLSGYKYCWHHAPLDPNSPFIWCQYRGTSSKNKKCSIPVLKTKTPPFCKYHMGQGTEQLGQDEKTKETEKPKDTKEKEKEKEKEKDKKKERKERKKKKKRKKRSKEKKAKKEKKLKVLTEGNGVLGIDEKTLALLEEDSVSGDDEARQLMINEEEDSDEGDNAMTIVDIEDEEIVV